MAGIAAAVGLPSSAMAQTQGPVTPDHAPAEWVRYAGAVTATISDWLEENTEGTNRLRAYLDQTRQAGGASTVPVELRVWIDPDGQVSRLEFTPFAHDEANRDLRSALVGRRLPAPPPEMWLPLRLAVQLQPEIEGELDGKVGKPDL